MHFGRRRGSRSDRARRIGVHGDIGAPVLRSVDRGAELGFGILADVDRIVMRRHAAARGELELARAEHQLLASALQHTIDAVGDGAAADRFDPAQRRIGGSGNFIGKAKVAMAAGLRDHRARRPDAGARHESLVDRALQAEGWPGHVANAGEAAHQRLSRFVGRDQSDVADIRRHEDGQRQRRQHRVPVRVDEARHQNPAAAIDDPDVGVERGFGRLDRLDRLAVDHNPQARQERVRLAVEQPHVGERDARARPRRSAGRRAARSRGEQRRAKRPWRRWTNGGRIFAQDARSVAQTPECGKDTLPAVALPHHPARRQTFASPTD